MVRHITSVQHELVKHLVKLRQNHDYRIDHQSLVIDGIKPVTEIGRSLKPKVLVAWDETLLPEGMEADDVIIVNESVMKKISGMSTPEGLLAEIPMPKPASFKGKHYIVALDGVSDPGNVGTILRTALALGWEGVFLLDESCDPFNEKALRAARGATFRLPLAWGNWEMLKKIIEENKLDPIVADLEGIKLEDVKLKNGVCLVLNNEAQGASKLARKLCQPVTIAMAGDMESLNVAVAGGILMHALKLGLK
jgi:TrmH family RNA methyltransferase